MTPRISIKNEMYYPSEKEFVKLAEKGNLIPVYREVPAASETPLSAFEKIDEGEFSYLLESAEGGEKIGRYSFLGSRPSLIFMSKGRAITIADGKKRKTFKAKRDPLSEIKKLMKKFRFVPVGGLPRFCGGLVGYMSYDMVRFFEKIPDTNKDELDLPEALFVLTDTILIFDHLERKIKIVSNAHIKKDAASAYSRACIKIDRLAERLSGACGAVADTGAKKAKRNVCMRSNFSRRDFGRIVKKAKEYIRKGDIIQVVVSQRFKRKVNCPPFDVYRALRKINPSPYMFYLKFGNLKLIGASPEIMVRCEGRVAELRPIAGTRRRGRTPDEDQRLAKELLGDPKERAEHIMLVDLGRNDIGRVCDFNSVTLSDFMVVEKYSHVMHIVSDVSGSLRKDCDIYDLVRATFPAGTVTGAPKIRAMEIIDELENVKRATYAGSIGYFSFSGNLDTCIAIRTILITGDTAYIQAGAGIVADSDPDREYRETINKSRAMLKAIDQAEGGLG